MHQRCKGDLIEIIFQTYFPLMILLAMFTSMSGSTRSSWASKL